MSPAPTRSHEHRLTIDAPAADVWKAITSAEELVRWFPLGASVTPGPGGEIVYRWGELEGRCRILAWEPPQHLRTGWMEAPATARELAHAETAHLAQRAALAVDWFLESAGKTTHLRVVHSGFAPDAVWDKEFDGTNRGWTFELQALKHYVERQRGQERRASWVRLPVTLAPQEVWQRFTRPGPVFRTVALDGLAAGDRFRLERADGEVLAGRVLVNHPPLEFAAVLDDGSLLRFGFEDCMGQPEAHAWLATWGLPASDFTRREGAWRATLARAFA